MRTTLRNSVWAVGSFKRDGFFWGVRVRFRKNRLDVQYVVVEVVSKEEFLRRTGIREIPA